MAKLQNFTLISEQDGLTLSGVRVWPEGDVRALVQLAHGMAEHKERYIPFMEALAAQGYGCAMIDHRGHGASVRAPEDLGYFYAGGAAALTEDMHQLTRLLRAETPDVPLILFGHSMGTLAARAYAERYDAELDGMVLTGSPAYNPAAGLGIALTRVIGALRGERHRSALLEGMTTGAFEKRFRAEGRSNAWLSAHTGNVEAYNADPLCGFRFTVNGYRATMELMRRAYGLKPPRGNAALPVFFLSGADDPCAIDERHFQDAVGRLRAAGYRNVRGEMLPGLRHEILNEEGREQVWEKLRTDALEPMLRQAREKKKSAEGQRRSE